MYASPDFGIESGAVDDLVHSNHKGLEVRMFSAVVLQPRIASFRHKATWSDFR